MCYFGLAFEHPIESINAISHAISDPKFGKIDLIVGTGISGTILLMPVSLKSGIRCGVVRKPKELYSEGGSHSSCKLETANYRGWNTLNISRYVIIDDFIDSGDTISRIIQTMSEVTNNAECAGVILYEGKFSHTYMDLPITVLRNDIRQLIRIGDAECQELLLV